jgi:hypothetical protein
MANSKDLIGKLLGEGGESVKARSRLRDVLRTLRTIGQSEFDEDQKMFMEEAIHHLAALERSLSATLDGYSSMTDEQKADYNNTRMSR